MVSCTVPRSWCRAGVFVRGIVVCLSQWCFAVSLCICLCFFFFFSSRRRHTRFDCDWSSDVCSSDLRPGCTHRLCIAHRVRSCRGRDGAAGSEACGGYGPMGGGRRQVCLRNPGEGMGDRERGVEGKRGELGGGRIIKKKKKREREMMCALKLRRWPKISGVLRAQPLAPRTSAPQLR